ncbi:Nonribosomal peptide synthetase 4 [Zalaria obscura]|uniref:Nonribosomal peptide synthetase 4 n=1 Tax=Zalaria obscura TaxID=2024903 RepID=A0ACC3S914_9PEZI
MKSNDGGFRSFEIDGLAQKSTPTGFRDEVLLLSWLLVLLRTQEGSQVSFDWAYRDRSNGFEREVASQRLSMGKAMTGLQDSVGQVTSSISRYLATLKPNLHTATSNALLLSTSSLSEPCEEGVHLEVIFNDGCLEIRSVWQPERMLQHEVVRHIETLADTVKVCISNPGASIEECLRPTKWDLDEMWRWNHELPPYYNFCMHEMVSERAQQFPDKVAITSWDGDLTYGEIESYSTFVACSLKDMGVTLHDVVPACFEKSRWTIVAVLAIMKAGATMALMDPTLPLARLQSMAEQAGAKMIVSSRVQHELSTLILPGGNHFVVEEVTFLPSSPSPTFTQLAKVPASALMYIIFTSGSTGTPKGVTISHGTYTSSAIPRAKAVGYTEKSRVLDFASYAFDVSIDSMLLTLGNGGTLCIPSDEDRLNDINGVIRNMQINYAGITPSMARILDPDVISSLDALGLGGEAAAARDVNLWGRDTRIIIGYGPCECTIGCTINSDTATGRDYISIGTGNGAAIWIVNPDDHEVLMPVGAVGELLVEGPIVGQGYLNDPDKTAAAFIRDPSWLVAGHNGYAGRRGRLYKTGDLGKYDPDGSGGIVFAGRKDTQVKLRGQRVELGEIESQLGARLPSGTNVIAEVITPQGSRGQPTLVAFIAPQASKGQGHTEISSAQLPEELRAAVSKANADVAKVLPRYMVPNAYIPVNYIPVLISGKTDRKRLRQYGATVDLRELDQDTAAPTRELSELEQRLRHAWSQVLTLDEQAIRTDDNFFALGGDSLAAMRLVSFCRDQGLELSVIKTFGNPTLSTMAGVLEVCDPQARKEMSPFSTISRSIESACLEASQVCGTEAAAIEDIYPCTPSQESLFTFSLRSAKPYVAQRVACIPSHLDVNIWKKAWEDVVAANPILRTRAAQLQEPGLQQVVVKEGISWRHSTHLAQYLEDDRNEKMDLGQPLARYAIIDYTSDGKRYMVWTVHHLLYDGWSEPLVLKQVSDALQGQHLDIPARMRDFVEYVRDTDEVAMQEFWRQELKGATGPQFPRMPSRDFVPTPNAMVERQIPLETGAGSPFTMATIIRGAWALVASQYTGSDDVLFGETLTGRDIPLPGLESIVGPLIATVPIRVRIDRNSSIESYLRTVQQIILNRTPYQHMGWQNIRKVSEDAQHASEAPTGLVIQPEPEYVGNDLGFEVGDVVREALHFNPYPLMVGCGVRKGGFRVCANFDSSLINITQMERILAQLEVACYQLTKDLSRQINEISCLPDTELDQIWQWNQTPPLSLDQSTGKLRADANTKQGSVYPPAAVTWICDPRNTSLLSPIGCVGEVWLESALLSGERFDSPAWLLAGSSDFHGRTGKTQPTGDLAQLREDGSLAFFGRKNNASAIQGHAMDFADLEAHVARHLPPGSRAAVARFKSTTDGNQEQGLVVFVEHAASTEEAIKVLPEQHDLAGTTICASISASLAAALKTLDKFIHVSLPSYMFPSAYIVVEKMPTETGQVDRNALDQLASKIPPHLLTRIHQGLKEAWTKQPAQTQLTASEDILRSSWATILNLSPEQIDVQDNFFRLGGDSVLAMKLVSSLRAQGHGLTVADIFQHMRLRDAAKVLRLNSVPRGKKAQPYKPFSLLGNIDRDTFLSKVVRPQLANSGWPIRDILPVTDSQALDVEGTIKAPRSSVQYTTLYFDKGADGAKLLRACNDLVATHDILRTVFIESQSAYLQVVLNELKAPIMTQRADGDIEQYVKDLCTADIETEFRLGSPFFKVFHVEDNNGEECLVIRLSHAQYDGLSLPRLLADLEISYTGRQIIDFEPYSSYVAKIRDESSQKPAITYWRDVLNGSSLSVLVGNSAQPTDKSIFKHKPVDLSLGVEETTTANLLIAAWALLLARRLRVADVTFGNVTSGRNVDLANVENVMGPCYQFTPVRVPFRAEWTGIDLLRFVQKQTAESAAHDFLGYERISKHCPQWSSETRFFDSIVHHQDDEDDVDTMPFAGGSCKVDILKPHGDGACPFKAVSFVQGGQTHVGVVGSDRDPAFTDAILDELAVTVQELTTRSSEPVKLVN